jgi:hypothetical protein
MNAKQFTRRDTSEMFTVSRCQWQEGSAHNRVQVPCAVGSRQVPHITLLTPRGTEGGIVMGKQISETLQEMLGILKEGRMTEGQERYFSDTVVTQEGNQPPIVGRKASIERLDKFRETIGVAGFVSYAIGAVAVAGDTSFYDAVLTLKLKNGETISLEQVVKTEWQDGKIIKERYYHG